MRDDISQQSFIRFAKALARWDSDWFGNEGSLAGTPYAGSDEARAFQAKAREFPEFVRVLASVLHEDSESSWAIEEGKELVGMALGTLITEKPPVGAAFFGLELVEAGIPMEPLERIRIAAFAVDAIADAIDPYEGEPKEEFLDTLIARRAGCSAEVPEADRTTAWEILQYGVRRFSGVTLVARARQYDEAVDFDSARGQLMGVLPADQLLGRPSRYAARDGLFADARLSAVLGELCDQFQKRSISEVVRPQSTFRGMRDRQRHNPV